MKNLYSYEEFINEDLFNFLRPSEKKITIEMKPGQIVCVQSQIVGIIHIYQLIDPNKKRGIFLGNLKKVDTGWIFRFSKYLNDDIVDIGDCRALNDFEKKIILWNFSNKIEDIKNLTNIYPNLG